MNYLKITNQGLIEPEDLMLIGSSTKRDQTGKIGMFGSGWKYALAWLMRNELTPIILAGDRNIVVDVNVVLHRNTPVKVITVDGRETSLTTEMGPKWDGWMALREILSNAIDEGNHSISRVHELCENIDNNTTTIFIPMNGELTAVMDNFDYYFAFERELSFFNSKGACYIKEVSSPINLYRHGIRCYNTTRESMIDFNLSNIDIDENRLCSESNMDSNVQAFVRAGVSKEVMLAILNSVYKDFLPKHSQPGDTELEVLKELLADGVTFTTESINRLGGIFAAPLGSVEIPGIWYKYLQTLGLVPDIFEMLSGSNEMFINTGIKNTTGISSFLSKFNISVEIKSGKCESSVFVNDDVAYVRDDTSNSDSSIAIQIIRKLSAKYLESVAGVNV